MRRYLRTLWNRSSETDTSLGSSAVGLQVAAEVDFSASFLRRFEGERISATIPFFFSRAMRRGSLIAMYVSKNSPYLFGAMIARDNTEEIAQVEDVAPRRALPELRGEVSGIQHVEVEYVSDLQVARRPHERLP